MRRDRTERSAPSAGGSTSPRPAAAAAANRWLDLAQITAIAQASGGIASLEDISLRVYAPEDYHVRLRRYFEEKGSMLLPVPGEIKEHPGEDRVADGRIGQRMSRNGVTQEELSGHLGCTQQFLSKVATGKRRWPPIMRERAEAYLKEKEGG